jgi:prepilin peptidase CpaA
MQSLDEQTLGQISWVLRLFVLTVLAFIAYSDWSKFKIPNSSSLLLLATGLLFVGLAPKGAGLVSPELFGSAGFRRHLISFAAVLLFGFMLFALKLWGAGDAKLLAALSIWSPYTDMPLLILSVACFGGVVALGLMISRGTVRNTITNLRSIFMGNLIGLPMQPDTLAVTGSRMPFSLAIAGGWLSYMVIKLNS